MGVVIDIALVLIVLIFAGVGLYVGFMDSLLKVVGSVGALLIAIFAARPVVSLLDSIFAFTQGLGNICVNWLCASYDPELLDTVLTATTQTQFLENLGGGIADTLIATIVNNASVDAGLTFREVLCSGFGLILGCIITAIVLFIIVKLIIFFIAKLFDSKEKGVLSGINRALGLILGMAKGLVVVIVGYTALAVVCMIFPIQANVDEIKNQSAIFKATYDPYAVIVQDFINDKMGDFVENFTNNLINNEEQSQES